MGADLWREVMGNPVKDEGGALGCITLVAFAAFLVAASRLGDIAYQLERIADSLAVLAGK